MPSRTCLQETTMSELFTFDNPVFCNYAYYGTLLIGKTVLMTPLTSFFRIKKGVYIVPEDIPPSKKGTMKIITDDPTIERLRRCHQNDIENIVPFALIGLVYVASEPDPEIAARLFKIFAAVRLLHSAVYLGGVRQPARFILSCLGVGINLLMIWRTRFVLGFYR